MNVPGTLTFSDLYGSAPPGRKPGEVIEKDAAQASGEISPGETKRPAVFWVVLVGLLMFTRWLMEKGGR